MLQTIQNPQDLTHPGTNANAAVDLSRSVESL